MNDLRDRFRSLDRARSPDLWWEIERRATAPQRSTSWLAGFGGLAMAAAAAAIVALVVVTSRGGMTGESGSSAPSAAIGGVEGRAICFAGTCEGGSRPDDPSDWRELLADVRADLNVVELPDTLSLGAGWHEDEAGVEWWVVTRAGERRAMGHVDRDPAPPPGEWEYMLISVEGRHGLSPERTWVIYAWRISQGD